MRNLLVEPISAGDPSLAQIAVVGGLGQLAYYANGRATPATTFGAALEQYALGQVAPINVGAQALYQIPVVGALGQLGIHQLGTSAPPVGGSGAGDRLAIVEEVAPWGMPFLRNYTLSGELGGVDPGGGGGSIGASVGIDPLDPPEILGPWGLTGHRYERTAGNVTAAPNSAPVWTISLGQFLFDEGVPKVIDLVAEGYLSDPDGDTMIIGITPTPPSGISVLQLPPRLVYDGTTPAGDYDNYILFADDQRSLSCTIGMGVDVGGTLTGAQLLAANIGIGVELQGLLGGSFNYLGGELTAGLDLSAYLTVPIPPPPPGPPVSGGRGHRRHHGRGPRRISAEDAALIDRVVNDRAERVRKKAREFFLGEPLAEAPKPEAADALVRKALARLPIDPRILAALVEFLNEDDDEDDEDDAREAEDAEDDDNDD